MCNLSAEKVQAMKDYCKSTSICKDKDGNVCEYREMCVDYTSRNIIARTPSCEDVDIMFNTLIKIDRYKPTKAKQIFCNSGTTYKISKHPSGKYYERLKNVYCGQRGFTIHPQWLDFQNFARYWDNHCEFNTKSPYLVQDTKNINPDTIKWIKKKGVKVG